MVIVFPLQVQQHHVPPFGILTLALRDRSAISIAIFAANVSDLYLVASNLKLKPPHINIHHLIKLTHNQLS